MFITNFCIICLATLISIIVFWRFPILKPEPKDFERQCNISVIIPARNEEQNLANLLGDLESQTHRAFEIICVNDGSSDKTEEVINEYNVKKINVTALPEGWRGKTWACHQGANKAAGEVLLFLDADVRLKPNAINDLLFCYAENESIVTVQPYHVTKRIYEKTSLFFNIVQIACTGMCMPRPKRIKGLFGPVFMINRVLFMDHGGYNAVKHEIVEDFRLGMFYASRGVSISRFLGGLTIKFQMYPQGLQSLIEGWTKNFCRGAKASNKGLLWSMIIWLTGLTVLPIELIYAISTGMKFFMLALSLIYAVNVAILFRISRKLGRFGVASIILYPLPLLAFHAIYINSLLSTYVFKSVTWKGRKL